jgi:hypothetical protein
MSRSRFSIRRESGGGNLFEEAAEAVLQRLTEFDAEWRIHASAPLALSRDSQQIPAIPPLLQLRPQRFELRGGNPSIHKGDFLGAGDPHALARFERADEFGGFEQAFRSAGVEP